MQQYDHKCFLKTVQNSCFASTTNPVLLIIQMFCWLVCWRYGVMQIFNSVEYSVIKHTSLLLLVFTSGLG